MKRSCFRRILFLSSSLIPFAILLGSLNLRALEVPTLRGRVNDLAGLMAPTRVRDLEDHLRRFEEDTGHQIAVLTIPSLEGENLEAFSIKVAETWKIGHKGFDNGVILLIARNDRKLRIEVGYGLEGVLPDALASRIIREVITPYFRSNDYPGGIEAGLDAIMKATRGEPLPEPARTRARPRSTPSELPASLLVFSLFLGLVVGAWAGRASRGDTGSEYRPVLLGGALGGMASAALGALAGLLASALGVWIFMVLVGSMAGALGSRLESGGSGEWSGGSRRRHRGDRGGGFAPSYGGGGSGGGGGFGGGGGGFGGGGASGSW